MKDQDIPANFNTPPWNPITDPGQLRALGKALEEVNELGAALARAIIQGIDGVIPETGKTNREWIEDEIADVVAATIIVEEEFKLDSIRISARQDRKARLLRLWRDRMNGAAT